jgi:isopenicillin-N epimerase
MKRLQNTMGTYKPGNEFSHLFQLNPNITFLNFGSFGACPKEIFEDYLHWQRLLEDEPVQFITRYGYEYLEKSKVALGNYIGCASNDLIFVTNPTYAINTIVRSLPLQKGDEILTTDLEYGAMDKTWQYYSKHRGWQYRRQPISLPLQSEKAFVEEFFKDYSDRTKAIFISHITSSTGLIFPVEAVCREAQKRGLITIVDGAHVPGHIPLNIRELNPDFYTGACHKWMMTPKGCSFLYTKKDFQDSLDPLIISWGYESDQPSDSKYFDYHQFNGTRDFSAFLTIPKAIDFMEKNNWKVMKEKCRSLVTQFAPLMADALGTYQLSNYDEGYGQLCSTPILCDDPIQLQRRLYEEFKIEIPVMRHGSNNFIRFSIQAFNSPDDLNYLLDSLNKLKQKGYFKN